MLRLRQIALVARELEPVEALLTAALATPVCYRDPGVGKYGLHNALWALGGTFLEVVAPIAPGTAAGRYLDRRKGDGGYMYIVDCDDLDARRAHLVRHGVRLVEDLKVDDGGLSAEALHLHPRDTGGCLLSIDRHGPESSPMGSYLWAGRDWQSKARADVRIAGATLQCDDPAAVAARWSELLGRPVLAEGEGFGLGLDNASARFVPLGDDRGEGLSEVQLACADPARVLAAALAAGAGVGARDFEACGVRFVLSHA